MTNGLMEPAAPAPPSSASAPGKPPRKSGWDDARRARQAAAIRRWQPWTRSTGPKTAAGKEACRLNAQKHGMR
ncbi:hypothetical protein NL455_28015, partial [Klebsiella pneumoniae]|nr:hypothetical protein [Klebsiella pneumoniae]